MTYGLSDNIIVLERICQEYQWKKISLMGHSMGSVVNFCYSGAFPEKVDMMIGIDALKSHIRKAEYVPQLIAGATAKTIEVDSQNISKSEPPSYSLDEMVEKWHESTGGSVTKECCKFLLKRNIDKSTLYPNKYFFSRDSRWKYSYNVHLPQDVTLELAKRIRMPYLFIKGKLVKYLIKIESYTCQ